jgi:hypothetical protein
MHLKNGWTILPFTTPNEHKRFSLYTRQAMSTKSEFLQPLRKCSSHLYVAAILQAINNSYYFLQPVQHFSLYRLRQVTLENESRPFACLQPTSCHPYPRLFDLKKAGLPSSEDKPPPAGLHQLPAHLIRIVFSNPCVA